MADTTTQIKAQLEELEKRVKSLSVMINTSSQISAIKAILDEIKELFKQYQNQIDQHITQSEESNFELREEILQLLEKYNQINALVLQLDQKVELLNITGGNGTGENGTGENCNIIETTNWTTDINLRCNITTGIELRTRKIQFRCEPTEKVKIKIWFSGTAAQASASTISYRIHLNGIIVKQENFPYKSVYTNEYVEYEFFPIEEIYTLMFRVYSGLNQTINNVKFEINGRNVCLLSRPNEMNVIMIDNKYYITKPREGGVHVAVCSPETLDLSTVTYDLDNTRDRNIWEFQACPKLVKQADGSITLDSAIGISMPERINDSYQILRGRINEENALQFESTQGISHYSLYLIPHGTGDGQYAHLAIRDDNKIYCYSPSALPGEIKFNGASYQDLFYDAVPVYNIHLTAENAKGEFYGCVGMKHDKTQVFIPDINSNYVVELGKGKHATAYYQQNGNIHVFFSNFHCLYKYVLAKNEENKYKIISASQHKGIEIYYEGYNGKAIAKKDGTYQVIDAV